MAAAIMRVYQTQFDAHPAATLAATNGGLSAVADVVAQTAQMLVSPRLSSYLISFAPHPMTQPIFGISSIRSVHHTWVRCTPQTGIQPS